MGVGLADFDMHCAYSISVDVRVLVSLRIMCLSIEHFHPLVKIKPLKYRTKVSRCVLKFLCCGLLANYVGNIFLKSQYC